jgi:hypothetical protein
MAEIQFVSGYRLEPSAVDPTMADGLAARVFDPLFLLARQWQLGEFVGENAASPWRVRITAQVHQVTAIRGKDAGAAWIPIDAATTPLERMVEAEGPPADLTGFDLRMRISWGARFLRALRAAGLAAAAPAFTERCRFRRPRDPVLAVLAARHPDPAALAPLCRRLTGADGAAAAAEVGVNAAAIAPVAARWLTDWTAALAARAEGGRVDSWDHHRFEHRFSLAVPSLGAHGTVLTAPEYYGGRLDWYHIEVAPDEDLPPSLPRQTNTVTATAFPVPVRYGGMPVDRFWEMEDSRIDFAGVAGAPGDIGRMLLLQFTTVYGNNWFVCPMRLPPGSLTVLDSVVVDDTFGRSHEVARAGNGDPTWNLFSLTGGNATAPAVRALYLPPVLPEGLESVPTEVVRLLRDEAANLAWAVEALVERDGEPADRRSTWFATQRAGQSAGPAPDGRHYLVQTTVPDYWIPLVPRRIADPPVVGAAGDVRLVLGRLARPGPGPDSPPVTGNPESRLLLDALAAGSAWLHEEEVPREGTTLTRRDQLSRWHGGERLQWTARRKTTGTGEGSSGLRHDVVDPPLDHSPPLV